MSSVPGSVLLNNCLSVIVRTCNRPMMITRALASIAAQTCRPREVIIVNDGGEIYQVRQVVEKWKELLNVVILENSSALGRGGALNAGIRISGGDWIAILDDDDTWNEMFVQKMMERIERNPRCQAVACQTLVVLEKVDSVGRASKLEQGILNPEFVALDLGMLAAWNQFTINALVFSRAVWNQLGAFREDISVLEDWEFNVRLASRYEIEVVAVPLAHYHRRPSSRDTLANTQQREHAIVYQRLINEWLREDMRLGRAGLGQLAILGQIRRDAHRLEPFPAIYETIRQKWRWVRGKKL